MATQIPYHLPRQKTLSEFGLKVGDIVTHITVKDSTGGVIFQIVEDTAPQTAFETSRKKLANVEVWVDPVTGHESLWPECRRADRRV